MVNSVGELFQYQLTDSFNISHEQISISVQISLTCPIVVDRQKPIDLLVSPWGMLSGAIAKGKVFGRLSTGDFQKKNRYWRIVRRKTDELRTKIYRLQKDQKLCQCYTSAHFQIDNKWTTNTKSYYTQLQLRCTLQQSNTITVALPSAAISLRMLKNK